MSLAAINAMMLCGYVLLIGVAAWLACVVVWRGAKRYRRHAIGMGALCFALDVLIATMHIQPGEARGALPHLCAAALAAAAVATVTVGARDWRRLRNSLTGSSLAEGLDQMSHGLLFYAEDGRVLLTNSAMSAASSALTGAVPLNGAEFASQMLAGEPLQPGERVIVEGSGVAHALGDGRAWWFSQDELELDGMLAYQLSAANVSELVAASMELEEENARLARIQASLQDYGRHVDELTRQQEILKAKMRVHDELGRTLVATERMLDGGHLADLDGLLADWAACIALLRAEARPSPEGDAGEQIVAAGLAIGIETVIDGELPADDPELVRVVTAAARECLTNAARHARASRLTICARADGSMSEVAFSNDGVLPAEPIAEGGGLSGLRHTVELAGGTMLVEHSPQFMLRLRLPRVERGEVTR